MLLERQDARKLAELIAQKMAKDPEKWRGIARQVGDRLPCSSPFGLGASLPPSGAAARALNYMHMAVNGVRPYAEGGGGRGGGAGARREERQGGDAPIDPCSYGVCPEIIPGQGYVCQEFHEACEVEFPFTCCSPFTCNPPPGNGEFTCDGKFDCYISFTCSRGRFYWGNGDCLIFACVPENVFHY